MGYSKTENGKVGNLGKAPAFWEPSFNMSNLLVRGKYPLADVIELTPNAISSGMDDLICVTDWYARDVKTDYWQLRGSEQTVINTVNGVEFDAEENGYINGRVSEYGSDTVKHFSYCENLDGLNKHVRLFAQARFFRPVWWLPVTEHIAHNEWDSFYKMFENHFVMTVSASTDDDSQRIIFRKLSNMRQGNFTSYFDEMRFWVMSEPIDALNNVDNSKGFGEGIPPMPGQTGNVPVRKPSNGDGAAPGGIGEDKGSYSSVGANWWGSSDSEGGK